MSDFADLAGRPADGVGVLTGIAASVVSSGVVAVTVGGVTVDAYAVRGVTLAVNDPVLIARQGATWWVLGSLFTAAVTPPEPDDPVALPPPKPVTTTGSLVCAPVETRSYRDGKWRTDTDDVLQGVYGGYGNNTGCAFYGSKPRSLKGATVTAARLKVKRLRAGAFAATGTTLRLVTQKTRPTGTVTLGATTAGPSLAVGSSTSSFVVPTSWAQAMVDGTAGGLAIYDADGNPYVRLAGRSGWAPAWTLVIDWKRST